jgi:GTPase
MEAVEKIVNGDVRAVARMLRDIDDERPEATKTLKELYQHTGGAYLLGITGAPGSGKSTLTDQLISQYRNQGKKVGVLAIDPTSPFSGGAILGDRIRMQRHETDRNVFIRSLATRGNLGGLTRSTSDSIKVLDAAGYDPIIVETVGVGQDEVEVVGATDTAVVVVVPGLGDDIQAIKAGIMEIADLLVVNKADREGARKTERELQFALELGRKASSDQEEGWQPPIVKTVATKKQGLDELYQALEDHRNYLLENDGFEKHRRRRARIDLTKLISDMGYQKIAERLELKKRLPELVKQIAERKADPYSIAESLIAQILE